MTQGDEDLEDLPPMLAKARRAWRDGFGGGRKRAGRRSGHTDGDIDVGVDWAQEAEELSVELAEFMLQSIGYDVKSVSPRQVEDLLVDRLRVRDPVEVRSILQGYPELLSSDIKTVEKSDDDKTRVRPSPSDEDKDEDGEDVNSNDGREGPQHKRTGFGQRNENQQGKEHDDADDSNSAGAKRRKRHDDHSGAAGGKNDEMLLQELLTALSRATEEEIRGAKGLFGLESGALERLKGGTRVTPFLQHGSLRRQLSVGAAPHGLTANGMKKWWRCPKCHVSQVVGLEGIHEHFKTCLVDPTPATDSPREASQPANQTSTSEKIAQDTRKRTRLVGTPFKPRRASKGGSAVGGTADHENVD